MGDYRSEQSTKQLVVFGASGSCTQIAYDLAYQLGATLVGYLDDGGDGSPHRFDGVPVVRPEQCATSFPGAVVAIAVHEPSGREVVYHRLLRDGVELTTVPGLRHLVHPAAELGHGSVVGSTSRIGPGTVVGRGALILADLVGHETEVGEFATLGMHSLVAGHVRIGASARIGMGAMVLNGTERRPLTIGEGAVVGAGAVIERDVPAGAVVTGTRGMSMRQWSRLNRLSRGEG